MTEMLACDRPAFLRFLLERGMERLPDRQAFANAVGRAHREGRIANGFMTIEEELARRRAQNYIADVCGACGSVPSAKLPKLLVCGGCKSVKYCSSR